MTNTILSTILKHDRKVNSYKIALLRAINDVVLAFPSLDNAGRDVVIPLSLLAQYWLAYYWPFVAATTPIWQGQRATDPRTGQLRNDISFRPHLTQFRQEWERAIGDSARAADGFFLVNELRRPRKLETYAPVFQTAYQQTITAIAKAIAYPIQYAGPGQWSVFPKPTCFRDFTQPVTAVPGTHPADKCPLVPVELWETFRSLSLWVEALCIHEWSLYTEQVGQDEMVTRGLVYTLLTDRPDNRRPLTWERNQVDLLLMEGAIFTCPWTGKIIRQGTAYDLDHLLPLAVYPTNELWNLLPSDPRFNQQTKRDKLPSPARLAQSQPRLIEAYALYTQQPQLKQALREDVGLRFNLPDHQPTAVAQAVIHLIDQVGAARNIARF